MANHVFSLLSWREKVAIVLLLGAVSTAACSRRQTVASRSAAAYRDAVEQGQSIGSGHGGHGAVASPSRDAPPEPGSSPMAGTDQSATSGGHEHAETGRDRSPRTDVGHHSAPAVEHPEMVPDGAAEDASAVEHREPAAGHHQHDSVPPPPSAIASETPDSSVRVRRLDPAQTLRQDGLDAAAPGSVAEAEKTAGGEP